MSRITSFSTNEHPHIIAGPAYLPNFLVGVAAANKNEMLLSANGPRISHLSEIGSIKGSKRKVDNRPFEQRTNP